MLKTLIKKQLYELNQVYFYDRKKGKHRTKKGSIGIIAFCIVIFFVVACVFYSVALGISSTLITPGFMTGNSKEWMYFAIMGLMAVALGTFGSVFNTYSGLYLAKDNELLLSLPIPPSMLLFVRIFGVYVISLLYVAIVWVPTVIRYWVMKFPTVPQVVGSVLLTFVITLFVTVLTCVLGWVVALAATKMKGKNFVVVIISLAIFGAYYYVCFHMSSIIQSFVENADAIGDKIQLWLFPIYKLGQGAAGNFPAFLIFTGIAVLLFLICYYVMARTFIRMITTKRGSKTVEYKQEETVKVVDPSSALLRRERLRYTGSSAYMLNSAIGLIIILVLDIFALFKMGEVRAFLADFAADLPFIEHLTPVLAPVIVCLFAAMAAISAASISMEGKNLWLVQSLPVSTWDVLRAKAKLHAYVSILPTLFSVVVFSLVLGSDMTDMILGIAIVWLFVWFCADFGLVSNLKFPNLRWTSEIVAVKQSFSVLIAMLVGWAISMAMLLVGILFVVFGYSVTTWLVVCVVVLGILYRLTHRWLEKKGTVKFESL